MKMTIHCLRTAARRACSLALLLVVTLTASGQGFLDQTRDYQWLVGETGAPYLTPQSTYYSTGYKEYFNTAQETNKLLLRGVMKMIISEEEPLAEQIDSALKKRAKIEVLRFADRSIDIAWVTEGPKIRSCLEKLKTKIDKITIYGGSMSCYNYFDMEYKKLLCGIQLVQDSYQDNSLRKREYTNLYNDALKLDNRVYKFLMTLCVVNTLEDPGELFLRVRPNVHRIAGEAHGRWMKASSGK